MGKTYAQLRVELSAALGAFLDPQEAQAEAMRWFEEGLGRSRAWMAAHGCEEVPEPEGSLLEAWLARRRKGEPWSYILGWTTFLDRRYRVTSGTLIPRPETELLVEAALDVGRRLNIQRVCDIGTGSGIIAISLALDTDWKVRATDISAEALEVARCNAEALGARVDFAQGHLLDPVPDPLELVVSNPPYVDPADRLNLQRELAFEPEGALFAEEEGLALSTGILRQAHRRLARGCVLEIGAGQGEILKNRAQALGWKRAAVHRDLAGHDRVLIALG